MAEDEKRIEVAETSEIEISQSADLVGVPVEINEDEKDKLNDAEEKVKEEVDKMDVEDKLKEEEDSENKEGEGSKNEEKETDEDVKAKAESDVGEEMKSEMVKKNNEESEKKEATKGVEGKRSRKRGKGQSFGEDGEARKKVDEKKAKELSALAFSMDRPVRERKTVERYSVEKGPVKKFIIGKGRGTALKDIPNVAYNLSRKKSDETFKMLHVILFARRAKAIHVKYNVSQFSGFARNENEEKQRFRVKEKFDKFVKEKLLEFCDVLDIPVAKTTTKEDIVAKLLDFLTAPHATTDVVLAETEKPSATKRRKRVIQSSSPTSSRTTAKRSATKRRKTKESSELTEKKSASKSEDENEDEDDEEVENGASDKSEEVAEHPESEEKDKEAVQGKQHFKSSEKKNIPGKIKSKKVTMTDKVTSDRSPMKIFVKCSSKQSQSDDRNDTKPRTFSRKNRGQKTPVKSSIQKSATKEKAIMEKPGNKVTDGNKKKKLKSGPTEEELRGVVCEIFKEVDFNTATFADIFKLLGKKLDTDLSPRKSEIKVMIQEELTKLAEENDEDGEVAEDKEDQDLSGKEEVEA